MMGVWLLSSFFANIMGGFVASYVTDLGAGTIFTVIGIFSIVLGVILFSLNRWLVKLSHGAL